MRDVVPPPKSASPADRGRGHELARRLQRLPRWAWFNVAAFAAGMLPVVLATTVQDRGDSADPDCVFHCYTLVHVAGPWVLGYLGAPAVISLLLLLLLHRKSTRRSHFADRAAWSLATVTCLISLVGLITGGLALLPVAVLIVCAVATAPLAPELRRADQSSRISVPAAARDGSR
jgi:hypothetical protein